MEPRPIESVHCIQQFVEVAAVDSVNIDDARDRNALPCLQHLLESTRVDTSYNSNHRAIIDQTFDIDTQEW